jgi:hypothetical protein
LDKGRWTRIWRRMLRSYPMIKPQRNNHVRSKQPREKQTTVVTAGTKRKGLGKGSPGCARKQNVTKRQTHTRSSESFNSRKRARTSQDSQTASTQPPARIAPRLEEGQSTTDPIDVCSQTTSVATTSTTSVAVTANCPSHR